jgi:hypothetical protein
MANATFFSVFRIPVFCSVASLVLLSVCALAIDDPRDLPGESVSSCGQFSYAQLTFESKDQVRWDEGGNDLPRTEVCRQFTGGLGVRSGQRW